MKYVVRFFILIGFLLGLGACSSGGDSSGASTSSPSPSNPSPATPDPNSKLMQIEDAISGGQIVTNITLQIGETYELYAVTRNGNEFVENAAASWVLDGSNGTLLIELGGKKALFTAVTAGSATLKAQSQNLSSQVNVIVQAATQCVTLATPSNGSISGAQPASPSNTLSFSCSGSFVLQGSATLTCQNDGSWDLPTPSCVANNAPTVVNESFDIRPGGSVSFNPLSNDSDADGSDTISISSMSAASNGSIVNNGDGTYTYTSSASFHGLESINYIVQDNHGAQTAGTVSVYSVETYEYTGRGGDSDWQNTNNWCGNITGNTCQGAGAAPGTTSMVYFSNACGSNCNITINTTTQAYEFLGMELSSNYTGTITLAGSNTFTLKTNGLAQAGGTIDASALSGKFLISEFDYNRIGVNLTGGQFVAPSEFEVLYKPPAHEEQTGFKATSDHTFVKGTGLVRFHVSGAWLGRSRFFIDVPENFEFYDLDLYYTGANDRSAGIELKTASNITISHDLTENIPLLRGGTFNVYNNYNQGDRLLGYRYMANLTNATVALVGSNSVEYSCAYLSDVNIGPILQINKTGGATVTPKTGTTDCAFMALRVLAGQFTAPSNFLQIGNITTFSNNAIFYLLYLEDGTTFNHNNGTLKFNYTGSYYINPDFRLRWPASGLTLNNFQIGNNINTSYPDSFITEAGGGTLTILGNVNIDQSYVKDISLPTVQIAGDISITGNYNRNFDLILNGTTQSISMTSTFPFIKGSLSASASTSVTATTDIDLSGLGSNLTLNSGTFNLGGHSLTVNNTLTIDTGTTLDLQTGSYTAGTTVNNGNIVP